MAILGIYVSKHLKIGQAPKGKDGLPTIHFQVLLLLVFREGSFVRRRQCTRRSWVDPPKNFINVNWQLSCQLKPLKKKEQKKNEQLELEQITCLESRKNINTKKTKPNLRVFFVPRTLDPGPLSCNMWAFGIFPDLGVDPGVDGSRLDASVSWREKKPEGSTPFALRRWVYLLGPKSIPF